MNNEVLLKSTFLAVFFIIFIKFLTTSAETVVYSVCPYLAWMKTGINCYRTTYFRIGRIIANVKFVSKHLCFFYGFFFLALPSTLKSY